MGNLTRLEFLDLSYNRLWGELPSSMTALTWLTLFNSLSNHGLCVPDDAEFQEWLEAIPSGSVWVITCNPPSTTPDAGDRAALITLYNATDGANWDDNTNWLSEQPLQYWKGVTINSEGRVTQLNLYGNQLSGDIPVELGNLVDLEWLFLHNNQLSGDIPATLGRPTYLEVLDLSDNQLTGAIPPELASLTELRSLTLDRNQLTGEIPDWLGGLDQLVFLSVNDNQLTGAIPPELGSLHQLGKLWLHNNQLTGTIPPELSNLLPSLEELFLGGNQLTGCILKALRGVGTNDLDELGLPFCENADLEALVALYIATDGDYWQDSTNWLTAAPLSEWHGVSTNYEGRVVSLDLEYNSLSGAVPPEIGGLINLSHLYLGSNQLTGTLPPEVDNLTRLEVLTLNDNRLWGPLPDAMTALSVLHRFEFDYNSGLCASPEPGFQEWLQSIPLLRSGPICVRTTSPPDDRDIAALTTLYNATSDDNWRDSTNWLSEQPLQYWKGVHINEEGRIVELRLGGTIYPDRYRLNWAI